MSRGLYQIAALSLCLFSTFTLAGCGKSMDSSAHSGKAKPIPASEAPVELASSSITEAEDSPETSDESATHEDPATSAKVQEQVRALAAEWLDANSQIFQWEIVFDVEQDMYHLRPKCFQDPDRWIVERYRQLGFYYPKNVTEDLEIPVWRVIFPVYASEAITIEQAKPEKATLGFQPRSIHNDRRSQVVIHDKPARDVDLLLMDLQLSICAND